MFLAAIGLGQMEVIEDHIKRTREINKIYREEVGEYFWDFQNERESDRSNMWLTCALMKGEYEPSSLIDHLGKSKIEARRIWKPMHQQPVMSKYRKYINGTADTLFTQGICLPSGSSMDDKDMERVIKSIKTFFYKVITFEEYNLLESYREDNNFQILLEKNLSFQN